MHYYVMIEHLARIESAWLREGPDAFFHLATDWYIYIVYTYPKTFNIIYVLILIITMFRKAKFWHKSGRLQLYIYLWWSLTLGDVASRRHSLFLLSSKSIKSLPDMRNSKFFKTFNGWTRFLEVYIHLIY